MSSADEPVPPDSQPETAETHGSGRTHATPRQPTDTQAADTNDFPSKLKPDLVPAKAPAGLPLVEGYEILGVLGRGGIGVVYKARHLRLNRLVALKMIRAGSHAGPDELRRFRTEAAAVARLQHPQIVQIYE